MYFILILIGFAFLIYFLLKQRASLQKKDLEFSADQAWDIVSSDLINPKLSKTNLHFGIWQDATSTVVSLLVKDSTNALVGQIFKPMGRREQTIEIDKIIFWVKFPLTWNRTAILYSPDRLQILAKYKKTGWLNRHEIEVPGYGVLKSYYPRFSFKARFNYKLDQAVIGTCQDITSSRLMGRVIVFPNDIPLEVRMFILSVA